MGLKLCKTLKRRKKYGKIYVLSKDNNKHERMLNMDEREILYKKLQQQVEVIIPSVNRVEINSSNVFIGNVEINIVDFLKMKIQLEEIIELPYETKIKKMRYGFIPIALSKENIFFKTIQNTLNELRREVYGRK